MFIDETTLSVKSGKGGDGMVHFRREKYIPRGGPDGGDGGRGGNVIIKALTTLNTLNDFAHQRIFAAMDGKNGGRSNRTGHGFDNQYEVQTIEDDNIVIDKTSGLMWQQGGSSEDMEYH